MQRYTIAMTLVGALGVLPAVAGGGTIGSGPGNAAGGKITVVADRSPFNADLGVNAFGAIRDACVTDFIDHGFDSSARAGDNGFNLSRIGGADPARLELCETDANIHQISLDTAVGKPVIDFSTLTALKGDGQYRLRIDVTSGTSFDEMYETADFFDALALDGGAAALNAQILSDLSATANFTAMITKRRNWIMRTDGSSTLSGVLVLSSDSLATTTCIEMTDNTEASVPTLSPIGLTVLVLLLAGAGLVVFRRRVASP